MSKRVGLLQPKPKAKNLKINTFITFKKKNIYFAPVPEKQKHDIKNMADYQLSYRKTKNQSCTSSSIRGELSINNAEIVKHFNKYFATIGSDLEKNIAYISLVLNLIIALVRHTRTVCM